MWKRHGREDMTYDGSHWVFGFWSVDEERNKLRVGATEEGADALFGGEAVKMGSSRRGPSW